MLDQIALAQVTMFTRCILTHKKVQTDVYVHVGLCHITQEGDK